jgi:hypothetical protein
VTRTDSCTKRLQPDPDLVARVIERLLAGEWSPPDYAPRAKEGDSAR